MAFFFQELEINNSISGIVPVACGEEIRDHFPASVEMEQEVTFTFSSYVHQHQEHRVDQVVNPLLCK